MQILPRLLLLTIPLLLAGPAWSLSITEIGETGAPGEDGESVLASASELAAGFDPAELVATATGGSGGSTDVAAGRPAGNGGRAGLDLFAASDDGEVTVRGSARGGAGGQGLEGQPAGDGAPVRLWNAVDGETSGPLSLSQSAVGGSTGAGSGGRAGAATSRLRRHKAAESLTLTSRAFGGGPFGGSSRPIAVAAGAPARASGHGVNTAGETRVFVSATGGPGGAFLGFPGQPGGDAQVFAFGRTEGDAQPVFVGVRAPLSDTLVCDFGVCELDDSAAQAAAGRSFDDQIISFFLPGDIGAKAGNGSGVLSMFRPPATPPGGDGGSARSTSVGIAAGDSPVEVRDVASGGHGGFQVGMDEGGPAVGGDAHSLALGIGGGASTVRAESSADAGSPGMVGSPGIVVLDAAPAGPAEHPFSPELGGRADATAIALGHGEVFAQARAEAGGGSWGPTGRYSGGRAEALASASGSDGTAQAGVRSSSHFPLLFVEVRTEVDVLRSATVEAHTGPADRGRRSRRGRGLAGRDARTEAVVSPDEDDVADALRREPDLADALQAAGAEDVGVLGSWQARQRQGRRGDAITSSLEIELTSPLGGTMGGPSPGPEVFIGLFAPELRRFGFESLRVMLVNVDEVLFDETFDDPQAARGFLDGALLEVGAIGQYPWNPYRGLGHNSAILRLELVTDARGAGLGLAFLVASAPVGEPAP